MYKQPHFTEQDRAAVLAFMRSHPFVTLIGYDGTRSVATQIPVLVKEQEAQILLHGHVMRKTDHHKALELQQEALVLFQGAHCYVSSSWYTEKMGATWNYQTVHVRGTVRFMTDDETMNLLTELTAHFEAQQKAPLWAGNLPEGYMQSHVNAIAGVEILVNDIFPIFKLSQNRDDESYANIIRHLQTGDANERAIAAEMKTRRPHL